MNKPTDKEVREYMLKNKEYDYFMALETLELTRKQPLVVKTAKKTKKGDSI